MNGEWQNLATVSHLYVHQWRITDENGWQLISVMAGWGEREIIWEDVWARPGRKDEALNYAAAVVTVMAGQIEQYHQQRKGNQ